MELGDCLGANTNATDVSVRGEQCIRRQRGTSCGHNDGWGARKQQKLIADAEADICWTRRRRAARSRGSAHDDGAEQDLEGRPAKQITAASESGGALPGSGRFAGCGDGTARRTSGEHVGLVDGHATDSEELLHVVPQHPYGVLPEGNALLDSLGVHNQSVAMGLFARLPHEIVLTIAGLLSPIDLTRLERTSSAMRAFAAHEPVWRELLIQHTDGRLSCWVGSWKATMAAHHRTSSAKSAQDASNHNEEQQVDVDGSTRHSFPHATFSNVLFLPLQLASLPMSRFMPRHDPCGPSDDPTYPKSQRRTTIASSPFKTLQRQAMGELTQESFLSRFAVPSVPCLLSNDSPEQDTPDWTIGDLQRLYPRRRIRAEALTMSMTTYAAYVQTCRVWERQRTHWIPDESPFYLFDPTLARSMQKQGRFVVPPLFRESVATSDEGGRLPAATTKATTVATRERCKGTMKQSWDLFSLLHERRPDHAWIIAGPRRSGSGWHVDPNHTSAYNTVLSGRKLWMLLPPHITPPGVFISDDGATVTAPLSIAEWLTDYWAACVQRHGRRGDNTLTVGVCGPGETIYVPAGWKHLVVNLEDSVAFTQNFVSPAELPAVLDFLKNCPDQISGFRVPRRQPRGAGEIDCEAADGDESDPELDELPDGGLAEKSKLFDLFLERLSAFDGVLCEQGVQAMEKRQEARSSEAAHHRAPSKWWRELKGPSRAAATSDGANQPRPAQLCLAPSEEDLGELPW